MSDAALPFPLIDISHFDLGTKEKQEVAAQLAEAARSIGFFWITGMPKTI